MKLILPILMIAGFVGVPWIARAAAPAGAGTPQFFEAQVAPILSRHCLECHDTARRKGKLDLSRRSAAFAGGKKGAVIVPGKAEQSRLWKSVASGDMPEDRPPLSAAEKEILRQWINAGAAWPGEEIDPVAHLRKPGAAQHWVRRLTVPEYIETIRATLGLDVAEEARRILPPDTRADGFRNTAYNLTVDFAHVEAYARMAALVVDRLDTAKLDARFPSADGDALIDGLGNLLLRGPLDARERAAFRRIADAVRSDGGDARTVSSCVLEAMLQAPRFLYRIEQPPAGGSPQPVAPHELAARLSYLVWGASPDDELRRVAGAGELTDAKAVAAQVRRMLADPRAVAQSVRFLEDWLNLAQLDSLSPDRRRFPHWNAQLAADMRAETRTFFEEIVWRQQRPLADLLNAQVTFVTPRLARYYGLEPAVGGPEHVTDGLLALYTLGEGGGEVLRDTAGAGQPLPLRLAGQSGARWDAEGLMTVGSARIASAGAAKQLTAALKATGALTIEAWVTPTDAIQTGPARVVSLSADPLRRNVTLGQEAGKWEVRLRTTKTSANGMPGLLTPGGVKSGRAVHLAFTFAAGRTRLYLDGKEVASAQPGGDLSNWDDNFPLLLGNEATGDRPWRGVFHRVAIYGRALSAEEVRRNHTAGQRHLLAAGTQTPVRHDLSKVPARGGLLTHGSVLTVGGEDASMVARGLFVLHDLLHSAVGNAPPGVDTTPVPPKPGQSHRAISEQRLKQASCAGCHSKFEPLAFALEKFDGLGAHREADEHGNRLREDGEILFPGHEKPVPFRSIGEFMDLLAGSDRVQRNFTRKFTQFALGRPLTQSDTVEFDRVHAAAQAAGGTYAGLLTALATSDFVRLSPPEPALTTQTKPSP